MVITTKNEYKRFKTGTTWTTGDVLAFPGGMGEIDKYVVRASVKSNNEIGINDYVSAIETNDDATDLFILTCTADNSTVPLFYTLDTEWNRNLLAKSNGKNDYSDLNRDTAKFKTGDEIDVLFLVPGSILRSKFAVSLSVKPGAKVQSAGGGKLDLYATVNARIGHILGQFPSDTNLNICAVMITF